MIKIRHLMLNTLVLLPALLGGQADAAPDVDEIESSIVRVLTNGGMGSGWVVSPGVVATNWHVVDGAREVSIIPAGTSDEYPATVLWQGSSDRDLALIEFNSIDLEPFAIHSNDPERGSDAFTVGFPGLSDSAAGIFNTNVSVFGGTIALIVTNGNGVRTIQHSNIVNAGNSGGPLLDNCARVLGLTTWGYADPNIRDDFIWASMHVAELARQLDALNIPYTDDTSDCISEGGSIDTSIIDSQFSEQDEAMESLTRQLYIYGGIGAGLLVLTLALALRKPRQQIIHAVNNVSRRITGFNPDEYTDRPAAGKKKQAATATGLTLSCNDTARPISLPLQKETLKQERHGISLGRSPELVDFCVDDKSLSRRHLRVSFDSKQNVFLVEDLGSTNGSFLNGRQLQAYRPYPVKVGDSLKVGALNFAVSGL